MKIEYNEAQRARVSIGSLAPGEVCMDADDNYYMRLSKDSHLLIPMPPEMPGDDIVSADEIVPVVDLSTGIVVAFGVGHQFFPVIYKMTVDR